MTDIQDDDLQGTPFDDGLPPLESASPVCEFCGDEVTVTGKGRPPKYCEKHRYANSRTTPGGASQKSVDSACSALKMLYESAQPLLAIFLPATAIAWSHQIDDLDARNRVMLKQNPKLVKQILAAGEQSGTTAFLLSHIIAIGPVAFLGYQEATGQFREMVKAGTDASS